MNLEDWKSDLGNTPTMEEIMKAKLKYEERKFVNMEQYLDFYLNLDCILLLKCGLILSETYTSILGAHIIDLNCKSFSSYSFWSTQLELARNAKPNVSQILDRRRYAVCTLLCVCVHFFLSSLFFSLSLCTACQQQYAWRSILRV